jgi:hypothetical protein
MLQGWWHKVVTILLYHDCIRLVGKTLQQVVVHTCWQLGTSSANTTCWQLVGRLATYVKISHLVASLPTSRQQVAFVLLVPSCQQVWNKLTMCNNLVDISRLVARLFQQVRYSHDRYNNIVIVQHCVVMHATLQHSCYIMTVSHLLE